MDDMNIEAELARIADEMDQVEAGFDSDAIYFGECM